MPKMTHWNSPEPIEVSAEKAAVYAAQGWVAVDQPPRKVQPAVVREDAEPAPAKKAAAKKATKKAAKKS
jgi:hypothetical protein